MISSALQGGFYENQMGDISFTGGRRGFCGYFL
jgi:hypothetical protein